MNPKPETTGAGIDSLAIGVAEPGDARALAEFAEKTFRDAFAADNTARNMDVYCRASFSERRQLDEINSDDMVTLIGRVDGKLVAYVQVCWDRHPDCLCGKGVPGEIRRIYVDQSMHGRGVGRQVFEAAVDALRARAVDTVWLAVWDQNDAAVVFYRRMGFTLVGETSFQLGDELQRDLVMAKAIDPSAAE